MKNSRRIFASCCSLAAAALVGAACAPKDATQSGANPLETRDAWARPADSGATSAVYFVLGNAGTASDTLTAVTSSIAQSTDMHVSTQHDGMMHMSPVTSLPVPAEDSVSFRPLGAHVMLTGLQRALVPGDTVNVTLRFVSGRTVEVRAGVRQP